MKKARAMLGKHAQSEKNFYFISNKDLVKNQTLLRESFYNVVNR